MQAYGVPIANRTRFFSLSPHGVIAIPMNSLKLRRPAGVNCRWKLRSRKKRRSGEGVPNRLSRTHPGRKCVPRELDVDARRDRLELAHALAQVRQLDPAGRGRKAALASFVRQLEAPELEPAVPRLERCQARSGEPEDDARAKHTNRDRVHHFSSLRSASISRASSSF